ncbi:MAG: DNA polymerase III subunit delta [Patescibacteria group bacterium]|nr:DNA polymerase III subunit delta [Patescibacteria group bacterium]
MIIFLYGEDDFRAKKKVRELKDKFLREVDKSGGSIEYVDGKTADLKQINEKAATASLLASKRMIIIEDVFSNRNKELLPEVAEYFKSKEKNKWDNIAVFCDNSIKSKRKMGGMEIVKADAEGRDKPLGKKEKELFDFLSKQKFAQEFKKLNNSELSDWIKKEVEARGGAISSRAVQVLIGLVGYDLWQIDREIDKLISFKDGGQPALTAGGAPAIIEENDVEKLVKGNFDDNIFALTDAIGARDKSLAAKLLEEQFELGANEIYLLTMITRQVKIILQVRQALDSGLSSRAIIAELKINPYVAQKAIEQARNFSLGALKIIFDKLVEMDYKIKSGQGDPTTLLDLLISKF